MEKPGLGRIFNFLVTKFESKNITKLNLNSKLFIYKGILMSTDSFGIYIVSMVLSIIGNILNSKLVIMCKFSRCKNIFSKNCTQNWSEQVFVTKMIIDTSTLALKKIWLP